VENIRHAHRREVSTPMAPGQSLHFPLVGLSPILRLHRNHVRRCHLAAHAHLHQPPEQNVARRTRSVIHPQRLVENIRPGTARNAIQDIAWIDSLENIRHREVRNAIQPITRIHLVENIRHAHRHEVSTAMAPGRLLRVPVFGF
jgi:hypothetical protein